MESDSGLPQLSYGALKMVVFHHAEDEEWVQDAAHIMASFADEGVNFGMEDARRLAAAALARRRRASRG